MSLWERFLGAFAVALLLVATIAAPAVAADDEPAPAVELRAGLGQLLGEHAFLLMEAMRVEPGSVDRAAFDAALDDNSANLVAAIASVYGSGAGNRFATIWDEHIGLLLAYGDAIRAGDAASQERAQRDLEDYARRLSSVLADLNPRLDAREEAQALDAHIEQIVAFADGQYADAYAAHRDAFEHMFELGDHLALGIARQFPKRFPDGAVAFSPRSDLRLALDRLLGEHMVLAAQAMRAGVTQGPDFAAAKASLDANSGDLADAVGRVYGGDAGGAFEEVWTRHTDAYLAFVEALGSGDEEQRAASLDALHAYHDEIADLFVSVNPLLDREAVADLIRRHVQALITQAEATAAGDPARAIAATREGYVGTFAVGAALADAIARQFPDRFRDLARLPATDTDPSAARVPTHPGTTARARVFGCAVAIVAAWAARGRAAAT